MIRSLLFGILLCLAALSMQAQNLATGYIVTHSGDTLSGNVHLKTRSEGSAYISVVEQAASPAKTYPLNQVKGYRLSNSKDVYQKWYVKMDMTYLDKWDLTITNVDSTRWDSVFLRLLYKGKSLSMYDRLDVKQRYFIYDNERMQELILKYSYPPDFRLPTYEFLARAERRQILAIYRDQLLIYVNQLRNNETLGYKTSVARYNEKDIKKIIMALDERLK
ncbi:MAG TPA: hypothetical protein VD993_12660 [Chitinophagaceae bacterium]|nr:hypothetical protein [Chitinophagaceae bacterium]